MRVLSFAQNREDVLLWRALGELDPGTGLWVDIGAADPLNNSVTKWFSLQGWRGVNVEPVPSVCAALREDRPMDINVNAAIGPERSTMSFGVVAENTELSSFNPELLDYYRSQGMRVDGVDVNVVTLNEIFQTHVGARSCVFLKVDVEGYESTVLGSLDWTLHRPWIVIVEATMPERWRAKLESQGYRFVLDDGVNFVFVANEQFERFGPALSRPVNCQDDHQLHGVESQHAERISRQSRWAIRHASGVIAGHDDASEVCIRLASLLVYRNDLQRAFASDTNIDRVGLLRWAVTTPVEADPEIALLSPGLAELKSLLAAAAANA